MVEKRCMSYEIIASTRMPCGGLYYTSRWPIRLWKNPRGLIHFRKWWKLVCESLFLLVFTLWSSDGFLSTHLCSSKVIPRWRSRVAQPSTNFLLTCTFIKLHWLCWLHLWKRELADTGKIFSYNHNEHFSHAIN